MGIDITGLMAAPPAARALEQLKTGGQVNLSNVKTGLKVFLSWGFFEALEKDLLIITPSEGQARKLTDALQGLGQPALLYPLEPIHTYFSSAHSLEITRDQMRVVSALLSEEKHIIVAPVDALQRQLLPLEEQKKRRMTLAAGDTADPIALAEQLVDMGYSRCDQVEAPGQFSLRGGILDIFGIVEDAPWRLDFFDEDLESIRTFDTITQRSGEACQRVRLTAAGINILTPGQRAAALEAAQRIHGEEPLYRDLLASLAAGGEEGDASLFAFLPRRETLFDYLADGAVIWDEPASAQQTSRDFDERLAYDFEGLEAQGERFPEERRVFLDFEGLCESASGHPLGAFSLLDDIAFPGTPLDMRSRDLESFTGNVPYFMDYLRRKQEEAFHICLCCRSDKTKKNLASLLREEGLADLKTPQGQPAVSLMVGEIIEGFECAPAGLIFINESEIFKGQQERIRKKRRSKGRRIDTFSELKTGDYVVHDVHGIGIYRGVEQLTIDGLTKDLMVIEYADDARFYMPIADMDAVSVYIGTGSDRKPKLNTLGRPDWARAKSRAKKAVEDMADELIALYAHRREIEGFAFGPDTSWQQEFEDAFPFEETEDQLRCVEEIKADMEKPVPMDRLLCGDVGYGKTEVALRAAFKAIMEGKQVAILVPTTILAQQHYNTITRRFSHYPVEIEMLSRFRTAAQQKNALMDLAAGKTDLIVGTHRLLSKDVRFKNLGLLIIDEEQRFGVRAKEKIKTMRESVDVLTLSATPIPRTLHMSMTGVRDMSVIEDPPPGRRPVQTFVMAYNPVVLTDAIRRELRRGGQVFFVHNRVHDIRDLAARVQLMVPEARIVTAHGQMGGDELEEIMMDFLEKKYDILVTTTIVESGMDVANANTMIIDNGDRFGLSQLYQLRGRVGRSEAQAYCYITYRRQVLSDIARKRLKAIKDFTAFGSGFKVALRDLEIRGAGNLLGAEQSGHMFNIGYEMYCRILEETISERMEGGGIPRPETPFKISLDVDGYLPESYIQSDEIKYDIYKKLTTIRSEGDFEALEEELTDRFGAVPGGVRNLMAIALIKQMALGKGFIEIRQRGAKVSLFFDPDRPPAIPDSKKIPRLYRTYGFKFKGAKNREDVWSITFKTEEDQSRLTELINFLKEL